MYEHENTFDNVVVMWTAPAEGRAAIVTCIFTAQKARGEGSRDQFLFISKLFWFEAQSSVCNSMSVLSVIISLIFFLSILSAVCSSLCFTMF